MKNRKKFISAIAIIMAVLMLLSLVVSVIPTSAYADEDYDRTLSTLQEARNAISSQISDVNARLETLREEESAVIDQKMALEERNECALQELNIIGKELELYNKMIEQKAQELEAAKSREAKQLEKYRTRVRAMEENGSYNILTLILNSDSYSELLAAIDDFGDIMESDRILAERYEEARLETEAVKQEYEDYKAEIEEKQADLEEQQKNLEDQIAESEELLVQLAEAIEAAEEEKRKAEEAEAAAAASIAAFIREYEAKRAENISGGSYADPGEAGSEGGETGSAGGETGGGGASSGGAVGTGSFCWPVPSSYRISSTFKYRWGRQHTGIDIDGYALDGYPIVAADGGTVILASYYGGYGNCVIIDHNNGYMTLYGHMSGFAVSNGSTVNQGDTIGYLGNTGNSFGTHCHFEVIQNGTQIDPLPYFSGYELEPGAAD